MCHQTISVSKERVGAWLSQYMFRNETDALTKGATIANWLGDASHHKTHGRPISILEAQSRGLKVTALESDQDLQDFVLSVFHALCITFETTGCVKLIENQNEKGWYAALAPNQVGACAPSGRP